MSVQPLVQYASRTDVGMRRSANQDSLAVRLCTEADEWTTCGHLFAVADGMGGHAVGDLASRITVENLPHAYFKMDEESPAERLRKAIQTANRAINDKARENPEFTDMGTTCSVLTLSPVGALVGQVGDSRVYRVRDGRIEQLTFDHSLQWEMMRQGRATIENVDLLHPRNVITRCLGPDPHVAVDIEGPFSVRHGDSFVLCSDGLTGHVSDSEIGAIVAALPPEESSRLLINLANSRGGSDNITAVVAHVQAYPAVSGGVVDSESEQDVYAVPTAVRAVRSWRSLRSWLSLAILTVLAFVGVILSLRTEHREVGLALISTALILGFVRVIMTAGRRGSAAESAAEIPESSRLTVTDNQVPRDQSPYCVASAELTTELLELLEQSQNDLTQACLDNGWDIDLEEAGRLSGQAKAAVKQQKPGRSLHLRGRAIDRLMREFYTRLRSQ